MSAFKPISLNWGDKTYTIQPNRVMAGIARVEDVLTLKELYDAAAGGAIKFTRIAKAYGEVLRYAGAEVSDDEVYIGMFQGEQSQAQVIEAITGLLGMMVPPADEKEPATAKPGNEPKPKAAAPSSKKPTSSA